jgi:hypothetical protein
LPRYLPIYGDMRAQLDMSMSLADSKCPFLVQDQGKRVIDWEKSRKTACALAKIDESLLFPALRRTALTNMIEAGFSEKEAMEISGHKTRAVFDRYHIVSQRRLNQLGERMEGHMRQKEQDKELMGKDKMRRSNKLLCFHGEPGGTRTRDHRIKSAMLYQLSYRPAVNLENSPSEYHPVAFVR